jgi:hypothetical protein
MNVGSVLWCTTSRLAIELHDCIAERAAAGLAGLQRLRQSIVFVLSGANI